MTNNITIKCNECGHEKMMGRDEIADLMARFNLEIVSGQTINESLKFRCSKCGSRDIAIADSEKTKENFDDSTESVSKIQCPYDGFTHKKGTLCPNFANHKSVSSHRRKQSANDMYVRKRSE
jgi:DNA-directed RNA polymerase subunit RPC12/RpoP